MYIFCSFSAALTHGMYNFEIDGCGMLVSLFIVCSLFSAAKITLLQHNFESLPRGSNSSIAKHESDIPIVSFCAIASKYFSQMHSYQIQKDKISELSFSRHTLSHLLT